MTLWAVQALSGPVIPDPRAQSWQTPASARRILLNAVRIFLFRELAHWIVELRSLSEP